jgi:hypothetical protein
MKTINFTEHQIKDIAENLECGLICYYNIKTNQFKYLIEDYDPLVTGIDESEFGLDDIEENPDDYLEFELMSSHQSFNVMADFAESVSDEELQKRLFQALNRPKPFRNFKWIIDNSGEYRQHWFDFKHLRYKKWVIEQLDDHNFNR